MTIIEKETSVPNKYVNTGKDYQIVSAEATNSINTGYRSLTFKVVELVKKEIAIFMQEKPEKDNPYSIVGVGEEQQSKLTSIKIFVNLFNFQYASDIKTLIENRLKTYDYKVIVEINKMFDVPEPNNVSIYEDRAKSVVYDIKQKLEEQTSFNGTIKATFFIYNDRIKAANIVPIGKGTTDYIVKVMKRLSIDIVGKSFTSLDVGEFLLR